MHARFRQREPANFLDASKTGEMLEQCARNAK